jgi:hypothetical protein
MLRLILQGTCNSALLQSWWPFSSSFSVLGMGGLPSKQDEHPLPIYCYYYRLVLAAVVGVGKSKQKAVEVTRGTRVNPSDAQTLPLRNKCATWPAQRNGMLARQNGRPRACWSTDHSPQATSQAPTVSSCMAQQQRDRMIRRGRFCSFQYV